MHHLRFWGGPALVVVAVVAFAGSIRNDDFVFDDQMWKQQLDSLASPWSETFWLQGNEGPQQGRPLAAATLAANYQLCGDALSGYRVFNLAIHALSGWVLFAVLSRLFAYRVMPTELREAATPLAWWSAAIWLVHPLQTECVNYVAQRTESMAALGILLALYCAVRSQAESPQRLGWMVLSVAAAWFAAGAKETAALIPLLVILVEFAFPREREVVVGWSSRLRERWRFYASLSSVWLAVGALMWLAPRTETVGSGEKAGVLKYLLNQCLIIPDYFRLAFWPHKLAVDYGEPLPVTWAEAAPGGILLLMLLAAGIVWLRNRPALAVAVLWVFLTLAPTSSFIPIQTEVGAERRMYLPLAAIAAATLGCSFYAGRRLLSRLTSRSPAWLSTVLPHVGRGAALTLTLGVTLALGARTGYRNAEYADVIQLWQSSFDARPNNPRAIYNLGVRLSHLGQVDAAIAAYRLTLQLDPNYVTAHNNLGLSLRERGDYAGAQHHFQAAAERYKNWTLALNNLARLYAACPDPAYRNGAEAVRIAEAICASHPGEGPYLETLAAAYAENGQFELAVERLQEAEALAPANAVNRQRYEQLRRQYERGEPFRFPPPSRYVRHRTPPGESDSES